MKSIAHPNSETPAKQDGCAEFAARTGSEIRKPSIVLTPRVERVEFWTLDGKLAGVISRDAKRNPVLEGRVLESEGHVEVVTYSNPADRWIPRLGQKQRPQLNFPNVPDQGRRASDSQTL